MRRPTTHHDLVFLSGALLVMLALSTSSAYSAPTLGLGVDTAGLLDVVT